MSLNENEKLVLEAIKTMLKHDTELGLGFHKQDAYNNSLDAERGLEYLHEQINEMFHHKAADLVHSDGVCQAFCKVHSYKYIDDPSFLTAMQKEMVAQAIPAKERAKALGYVSTIINTLAEESKEWSEKDSGFNPELDEILNNDDIQQPLDFNVHETPLNKANIKSKYGDAEPGMTPSDK